PVRRELLVGRGVDESSYALDGIRDLLRRRPASCALEVEMLDEMRYTAESVIFKARAAGEHQDDARGVALRHRLDHQTRPSRQRLHAMGRGHGIGKYRCPSEGCPRA